MIATIDFETTGLKAGEDEVLQVSIIDENYNVKFHDWNAVKSGLRDELSRLMYERTKRRPMILPILMEI